MKTALRFIKLSLCISLIAIGLRYVRQSELPDSAIFAVLIGIGSTILWMDWRKN
jgi:hypothetical protein